MAYGGPLYAVGPIPAADWLDHPLAHREREVQVRCFQCGHTDRFQLTVRTLWTGASLLFGTQPHVCLPPRPDGRYLLEPPRPPPQLPPRLPPPPPEPEPEPAPEPSLSPTEARGAALEYT